MQMKKKQVGPIGPWVTTKSEEPATQKGWPAGAGHDKPSTAAPVVRKEAVYLPWNIPVEQLR
jgi:hypothetical protein